MIERRKISCVDNLENLYGRERQHTERYEGLYRARTEGREVRGVQAVGTDKGRAQIE